MTVQLSALPSAWFRERNQLNHDWLRNTFFLELSAIRGRCVGDTSAMGCCLEAVSAVIEDWNSHRTPLEALIDRCEVGASPVLLFKRPPLAHCDFDVLEWLPEVIHRQWLARNRIKEKSKDAQLQLIITHRSAEALEGVASSTACCGSALVKALDAFMVSLTNLSDAISKLPNRFFVC